MRGKGDRQKPGFVCKLLNYNKLRGLGLKLGRKFPTDSFNKQNQ